MIQDFENRQNQLRKQLGIPELPKGIHLFTVGPVRHHNAVVKGLNTWDAVAEGYKRAATLTVNQVLKKRSFQDFLVYPICFLYRNYLEVRLKELIGSGLALSSRAANVAGYNHNLQELWKDARDLIKECLDPSEDILDSIGGYIGQFHQVDCSSDGFRYPVDTTGNPNLRDLHQIDLGTLKKVMEAVASELDGFSTGLDKKSKYSPK